jgi:AAA15 family ATPase/GTPase/uncharacterized protein YdcH (DUF465 family)
MSRQNIVTDAVTKRVSLKNLYLDPNNYRLIHELDQTEVKDENIKDQDVAKRTFRLLIGEKNQYIQDLLDSFRANGYLPVDQIQVRDLPNGGYVVVEGNRRVAALKFLEQEYENKRIDLGNLDRAIFSHVPVVMYSDADEIHHLTLMALKHISGNRKWGEWNQAKLLEKMSKGFNLPEEDICKRVGITKTELRRSLRALSLVEQYEASDYGDQFNETKFPIFREAVRSQALKAWLEWDEATGKSTNSQNSEIFFSLLSKEPRDDEEDDDGHIGYGSGYRDPVIIKRDDIRAFAKILEDHKALDKLIESRDFWVANNVYSSSNARISELSQEKVNALAEDVQSLIQFNLQSDQLSSLETSLGGLQSVVNKVRANSNGLFGVEGNEIFREKVDQHLSSLHIKSYKRFKDFQLDGFSKINFFAGLNNCGKTTLLESICLLVRQNDFKGLLDVVRRRGKLPEDQLDMSWLKKQLINNIEILGIFDSENTSVSINDYQDARLDRTDHIKSTEITSKFGVSAQESITHLFRNRKRETIADSLKSLSRVVYSSPFFLNEPQYHASFYQKSVQSKALSEILSFIKNEVVPTLNDIRLVDDQQRFLVDDSQYSEAGDLTNYGEGLQRIFFISLLFASAQDGILLIDEFENAIHMELISQFAPFVHKLAIKFNVQLFITTHSKECIDAFVKNVEKHEDFSYYTLVNNNGEIVSRHFDGVKFYRMVERGNLDLRRIR